VVNIMAIVTMAANSAIMNAENFMALYSVWYPATSSDSDSGMSKGTRLVSAKPETRKMKAERASGSASQPNGPCCCAVTISTNETLPTRRSTGMTLRPIATS